MSATPITVRPGAVFPPGTSVSAYADTEGVDLTRRDSLAVINATPADTTIVNPDGLALLSVDPATATNYVLIGTVAGTRRAMVFTTLGEDVAGDTAPTNEIQTITVTATGGTFTITFNGQTTTALPYNETAANVKTALAALSNLDATDLTVALDTGVYTVTFAGQYEGSNVPQMTVGVGSLTGGTATVATTQQGGA